MRCGQQVCMAIKCRKSRHRSLLTAADEWGWSNCWDRIIV